jgi:hypothetical protein
LPSDSFRRGVTAAIIWRFPRASGVTNRSCRYQASWNVHVERWKMKCSKPTTRALSKPQARADNQRAYRLAPQQGRKFRIVKLEGFVVEFLGEGAIVDELIFHLPNGTFVAKHLEE